MGFAAFLCCLKVQHAVKSATYNVISGEVITVSKYFEDNKVLISERVTYKLRSCSRTYFPYIQL